MALEDLEGPSKFIDDLVSSNPAPTDDRSEGDNHVRGVKNVLKNSFPQVQGAVAATHEDLSELSGYDSGAGSVEARLAASKVHQDEMAIHFDDVSGDGLFVRSAAGWVDASAELGDLEPHISDTSIHFGDVTSEGTYGRTLTGWAPLSGAGNDTLDMNTGGVADPIALDLGVYQDSGGGLHEFVNDVLSYNILGSTVGKTIGISLDGGAIADVAIVGKNGAAHGWVTAHGIEGIKGWTGNTYARTTSVQFFERGPDVAITPVRTVQVTKTLTASSGAAFSEVVTAGLSGVLHLTYESYRDSGGGDHVFGNTQWVWEILGATPGKRIGLSLDGGAIFDISIVGSSGEALGWVTAAGISGRKGWTGDNFVQTTSAQFYERSPDVAIGPPISIQVTKTTTVSAGTQPESIVWQEHGLGTRDLEVRYINNFRVDYRSLAWSALGMAPNAEVIVRAPNNSQEVVGYTNSQGMIVGALAGYWLPAWGYSPGAVVSISILIGGVVKGSVSVRYIRTDGG